MPQDKIYRRRSNVDGDTITIYGSNTEVNTAITLGKLEAAALCKELQEFIMKDMIDNNPIITI